MRALASACGLVRSRLRVARVADRLGDRLRLEQGVRSSRRSPRRIASRLPGVIGRSSTKCRHRGNPSITRGWAMTRSKVRRHAPTTCTAIRHAGGDVAVGRTAVAYQRVDEAHSGAARVATRVGEARSGSRGVPRRCDPSRRRARACREYIETNPRGWPLDGANPDVAAVRAPSSRLPRDLPNRRGRIYPAPTPVPAARSPARSAARCSAARWRRSSRSAPSGRRSTKTLPSMT